MSPQHLLNPSSPPSGPPRGPLVERVAGWSGAHRKTAVFGWLLLVIVAVMAGQMLGAKNVPSYDPGQAGRAERVLSWPSVRTPPSESVLIQAHAAGATFATDPQLRQAAQQVVMALRHLGGAARDIRSPLAPHGASLVSADGRSALVTFTLAGNANRAVTTAERAVAAIQGRNPGLTIAEAGDTSLSQAVTASVSRDFRHAEVIRSASRGERPAARSSRSRRR